MPGLHVQLDPGNNCRINLKGVVKKMIRQDLPVALSRCCITQLLFTRSHLGVFIKLDRGASLAGVVFTKDMRLPDFTVNVTKQPVTLSEW